MSKPPTLEPRWLVGLISQWAIRSLYDESRGLGYPSISVMLKDGIPGRVSSYDPTGYGAMDFKDIERAIGGLEDMRKLAVLRFFKPWAREEIDLLMKRDSDTWLKQLKLALVDLERMLERTSRMVEL